jgi:hypothetical protein
MKHHIRLSTLGLVVLLLAGCSKHSPNTKGTEEGPPPGKPTQQQVREMKQVVESFAQVKTRPLNLAEFAQAIQGRAGTNLDCLSESERKKLFACINRFYACYSSGDYEEFKRFRLHAPFTMSEDVVAAVKNAALAKGVELKSDEDILRFAWSRWNGTNKIGQVSGEHVILSVVERQDLGQSLRAPSVGQYQRGGASCWEGAVAYQPAPADLLQKHGVLRFFTLELLVRFSPLKSGPASPLVLIGYWDPTREDWMPDALCTTFRVGHYDTMF